MFKEATSNENKQDTSRSITKGGAVHRRMPPRTNTTGYSADRKLSLSRKRRHIVIALLPVLEAEGTIEHLDEEGPMPTL